MTQPVTGEKPKTSNGQHDEEAQASKEKPSDTGTLDGKGSKWFVCTDFWSYPYTFVGATWADLYP